MDQPILGRWIDGVWIEPMDEYVPTPEPELPSEPEPTPEERMNQIEAALIELAGIIAGGE